MEVQSCYLVVLLYLIQRRYVSPSPLSTLDEETDHNTVLYVSQSWKHIDLCPSRKGFFVAQGIVNLNENGPEDGGLMVIKGSSRLIEEYFDEKGRPPLKGNGKVSPELEHNLPPSLGTDSCCIRSHSKLIGMVNSLSPFPSSLRNSETDAFESSQLSMNPKCNGSTIEVAN